jgi:predicted short-subunit dehydrogenase-like oxidoreductase (DUF2520 family)
MSGRRSYALIGPGRVGRALALGLGAAGWPPHRIAGRRAASGRSLARRVGAIASVSPAAAARGCDGVLLTVPSTALRDVAEHLSRTAEPWKGRFVLFASGTADAAELGPLVRRGARISRLHPLLPFAGRPADVENLAGSTFGIAGDPPAVRVARRMIRALGARALEVPAEARIPYHVAAVLCSNLLVALVAGASGLAASWGSSPEVARQALLPLMRATLANLEQGPPAAALTGPAARGEAGVVAEQRAWLARQGARDLEAAYRSLSRLAVEMAASAGRLDGRQRRNLLAILSRG